MKTSYQFTLPRMPPTISYWALGELGIDFFVRLQKTAARVSVQFTRDDYLPRHESRRCNLVPAGKRLRLKRAGRSAERFCSIRWISGDCALCPLRNKMLCVRATNAGARKVSVSYFAADRQHNLRRRLQPGIPGGAEAAEVWCEGSFSAQKREHN